MYLHYCYFKFYFKRNFYFKYRHRLSDIKMSVSYLRAFDSILSVISYKHERWMSHSEVVGWRVSAVMTVM